MSEIKIIDNFLNEIDFANLQNFMMSGMFPWYYNDDVLEPGKNKDSNYFQFTHIFYGDSKPWSNYFDLLEGMIQTIDAMTILRIKANLLTKSNTHIEHGMHTDYQDSRITTAVFYVNTNNGYTLFDNGERVMSVENRLAIFPCTMNHTGSTCTDEKTRIVININYLEKEII